MRNEINILSSKYGQNPLLVQSAGGNISWKEDKFLWIKASGTWLSSAHEQDIFVKIDLNHLKGELSKRNFEVTPKLSGTNTLRPSIETLFHAILPQKIVVHLHMIDCLATLVRADYQDHLSAKMTSQYEWASVGYYKPGSELAQAVYEATSNRHVDILFMKSHGIIISGETVSEIEEKLDYLNNVFGKQPKSQPAENDPAENNSIKMSYFAGFKLIKDDYLQQNICNPKSAHHMRGSWAICPDHVVFLGAKPTIFDKHSDESEIVDALNETKASYFIIDNYGLYVSDDFTEAARQQMVAYFQVMERLEDDAKIDVLNDNEIGALLNWDAETYRQNLNK